MNDISEIALSVRQPWAWAIIHAGKDIENRSALAVRHGMKPRRIAIHAAKGMTRWEYENAADFMTSIGVTCPAPADLVRGAIIGSVDVVEVVKESASVWFSGPRGLVLANAAACEPVPAVGALGYFRWSPGRVIIETPKWMTAKAAAPASAADLLSALDS